MSRVAIIGGAGRVGASFAFHLLTQNICREMVLIDILENPIQGERLDLMHATSSLSLTRLTAGTDAGLLEGADVIVIPAGARRRANQSRLELIRTNVGIIDQWMDKIGRVNQTAVVLVVVNPVDVLTYRAYMIGGQDRRRILGLGNVMDTVRFASNLAERFDWDPRQVNCYLLGEHGDSMVPVWSQANYSGLRLRDMRGVEQQALDEVYAETRKAGAEVIRLKGGAGWAVGVSITAVVRSILLDEKRVLCVSSVPDGEYGVEGDVALSLPAIIGKNGVEGYLELDLDDEEMAGIRKSAEVLRESYKEIA
ncbi:lactate dehydrogenase [bacterium]|nr:lactate dehydrogenase [bacterium]